MRSRKNYSMCKFTFIKPKKKLVRFRFPTDPAQLHATFRGLRDFRKNSTKHSLFSDLAFYNHVNFI